MGSVVGEDKKWVLNHLPVALPKYRIGLILGDVVEDSLRYEKWLAHAIVKDLD